MSITIINPRNQQGLRYLFDICDPKSNPEHIDMTAIQPVIDMNFSGFAKLNDYSQLLSAEQLADSIAGSQTKTWRILSNGNAVGADTQVVVPVSHNFLCWGIKQHIYFDAAGAAAFSGKYISSEILMTTPASVQITKWHGTEVCSTGNLLYAPGFRTTEQISRQHLCVIPSGCVLDLVWWCQDGTVFPANTVVRYAIVGQAFPNGAPLPIGI